MRFAINGPKPHHLNPALKINATVNTVMFSLATRCTVQSAKW